MSTQEPRRVTAEKETPWRLIAFAVLAVYAILIILFNRKQVDVSFVFFSARISLLVLILLCVGIGFATGYLFDQLRDRRKQRSA
ncbi:MAG TPA: LapA family protein [Gaiellaceae bacterium]|nr:LapA family protein [Gaiellaceae bacterium]